MRWHRWAGVLTSKENKEGWCLRERGIGVLVGTKEEVMVVAAILLWPPRFQFEPVRLKMPERI